MSVLMIFASCSTDIPYEDIDENTKTVEEPKEDDTKNNTEEPSNEEDDTEIVEDEPLNEEPNEEEPSNEEDDTENDNDGEGNSENAETVEDEPLNEDGSENEVVEDKTWCEIDEDTNILELNYIGYYENFTAIFNSDSNDPKEVKTTPFTMRCDIPSSNGGFHEIVITVKYNEGKLDFSINSQSPYYTIKCVNYSKLTSTIDIMILHK